MESEIIKYFNQNIRDNVWAKNGPKFKKWFKRQLKHLLVEIEENSTEKELNAFMYRLGLGYWGIGKQKGIFSGIKTEDAILNKNTNDHVFGVVEIGRFVHQELIKNNLDVDYMVNEWLYNHLWLWMTIKVSVEEHKKDNIIRNKHTIEEKKELRHYQKISNLIFL